MNLYRSSEKLRTQFHGRNLISSPLYFFMNWWNVSIFPAQESLRKPFKNHRKGTWTIVPWSIGYECLRWCLIKHNLQKIFVSVWERAEYTICIMSSHGMCKDDEANSDWLSSDAVSADLCFKARSHEGGSKVMQGHDWDGKFYGIDWTGLRFRMACVCLWGDEMGG